jgi:hypothetical protein
MIRMTMAALVLTLAGRALGAPTPEARKQARAHYAKAVDHFNAGAYDAAATEFLAVYQIAPQSVLLYDAAQAYRLGNEPAKAVERYKQYLAAAPPHAGPRAEVERRIRELQGKPPVAPASGTTVKATTTATAKPDKAGGSDRLHAIVDVIKQHRPGFRGCFDRWSEKHPGISGKVTLSLYLDPDGNPDQPDAVPRGFDAPEVASCMEDFAQTLQYPKSPSGKFTRFSYPFDFKAH